jgi:hypothetical protein
MRFLFFTLFFFTGLIPLLAETAWTGQSYDLTINPEVFEINTFYSGAQLAISGEIPNRQDVIIEIAGPVIDNQFDLKQRVGPFWMTRDKADLNGAPAMYVLLLPGGREWQREATALSLGLGKLKTKISIHSDTLPPDDLFNMFLELKKSEGQYLLQNNAVTYAPTENGNKRFTADFRFPRSTVTGKYTVKAVAVADGVKCMEQSRSFVVNEVGFVRLIDDLATNQRLIYGISAVVIALFAGSAMGILFKSSGSH